MASNYPCEIAKTQEQYTNDWAAGHRRHFSIAEITIRVESAYNVGEMVFNPELQVFATEQPGDDLVTLVHHFALPDLRGTSLGREVYRKPPWAISCTSDAWFYRGITPEGQDTDDQRFAVFTVDHQHGVIYNPPDQLQHVRQEGWMSLTLFPTDQIVVSPLLAPRHALLLHSAAVSIAGQGVLFVGHSSAGKSTTCTLLKQAYAATGTPYTILCDDRNIVRRWPDGWRVYGTWSHGTVSEVSAVMAPLRALCFLIKDGRNAIEPITDPMELWRLLLATTIRGITFDAWWRQTLTTLERLLTEIPCYRMYFDTSGAIAEVLLRLAEESRRHAIVQP